MWDADLLKGELLEYAGDPLLDFGLTNFLDRISFKQPKSGEKLSRDRQRMAQFEKPINLEASQTQRLEEEFMHRYFEQKPRKQAKTEEEEADALNDFADKVIEDKMRELNRGAGLNEASDEDEISDGAEMGEEDMSDFDDDAMMDDGDEEGEGEYFEGQDLEEVQREDSDQDEDDDLEEYGNEEEEAAFKKATKLPKAMREDSDEDSLNEMYGSESEQGEELPQAEGLSKSQQQRQQRK